MCGCSFGDEFPGIELPYLWLTKSTQAMVSSLFMEGYLYCPIISWVVN